jgi:RNA polymerase sigma factor (sigma-70 family)
MNATGAEFATPDPSIALLRAASRGDQAAWADLYSQHRALMRTLLHGRIPSSLRARFDTEDVMQSALLALCRHQQALELQDGASFRNFLAEILRNKLRDKLRHHLRERRSSQNEHVSGTGELEDQACPQDLPPEIAEKAERQAGLLEALNRLPPEDQDLIWMRYIDHAPWAEVCAASGLGETTARRRTHEALERLMRACL